MARSSIAAINAEFRALETERGFILRDPYAALFVERNLKIRFLKTLYDRLSPFRKSVEKLQAVHCIRHRAVDELLVRELRKGPRDVLVLGAGYDMRAARFRDFAARWIEVDSTAMIERKAEILRAAEDRHPEFRSLAVNRIAADLNRAPMTELLGHCRPDVPTVVVAEGLIHYMDPGAIAEWIAAFERAARKERRPTAWIATFIPKRMVARADFLTRKVFGYFREMPVRAYDEREWRETAADRAATRFEFYPIDRQIAEFCPRAGEREIGVSQDVIALVWDIAE